MTVARIYTLETSAGREQNLRNALTGLAETILGLPGCGGVELLQDAAKPHRFTFIEKWVSFESHKIASSMLPKDAFASVMQLLASKPESSDLNYLIAG
jgi:quinol monooxygenase YgiN